ncbi:hypothetical protein BDF20DRAFT_823605 [Mycotypha africana]|uniref:uncharacterized protein n=1 Tax=Mycotypha africana TaxID=64632 RepID=UPI002301BDC9|nr:uncharacterized protein BDF20DRAFT_823605 [Mycotypha africana]KAI8973247.1 hypothetical protein BDF20DRAFT_823605 [Mycotypha africana]
MFTLPYPAKEKVKPPYHLRSARVSVVKQHISTPINVVHHVHHAHPSSTSFFATKSTTVIKALYDYTAKSPYELSFEKGDFFFLSNRPVKGQQQQYPHQYDSYYEAFNPINNTRGLVPRSYFELVEKNHSATTATMNTTNKTITKSNSNDQQQKKSDELNAKAGEPIMIMAQSNSEWFIAKPIGRLGGPGLIPVSFVEIRRDDELNSSNSSGSKQIIATAATAETLPTPSLSVPSLSNGNSRAQPSNNIVISAYIDSYILEGEHYWFIIFAKLKKNGKYRVLYRLYEDFYDFQILFLQAFPVEAGKTASTQNKGHSGRILPYMPGPLDTVNEDITADRAKDLSKYCHDLLNLPSYLSHHYLVQEQLFGLHEGDIETDIDPSIKQHPSELTETHNNSNKMMKVKIMYRDEMFAIKIPMTSSLDELKSKIVDRLMTVTKTTAKSMIMYAFSTFACYYFMLMNDNQNNQRHEDDDLTPTQTSGYKPGEKKSIAEYQNLDAQDESLNKWKASLGLNKSANYTGPKDDPRNVVVEYIALEVEGREDVRVDLSTQRKVQHDVVSGLKYLQVVKRKGIRVDKTEEMIGSYGPSPDAYEKKFASEEAPSGMLARGHYEAKSKFVDDDGVSHMEWTWSFDIKKDW